MPKSSNQKLKLYYLIQILQENTDVTHVISMKDIITKLALNGIDAERKSIYNDIELLNSIGIEVEYRKEKPRGYSLITREFELAELKLLVDAVQSSKCITAGKSNQLIHKLENQASKFEASQLQRQVFIKDRTKTENEKMY